jgi:hypothetical protein
MDCDCISGTGKYSRRSLFLRLEALLTYALAS